MTKKRKIVISSVVGAVIILLAVGYFVALPQVQASSYVSSVRDKQSDVQGEVSKLRGLLAYDLFTKSDQTSDEVRVDVKNATEVIAAIKSKIAAEGDALTKFDEYPLLSWHPTYKNALDLQAAEKTYIAEVNRAVAEMEAVLEYADDASDIITRVEGRIQAFATDLATAPGIDEMVDATEEVSTEVKEAVAELEKLTPPESYTEYHAKSAETNKAFSEWLDDFIAALKAEDLAELEKLNEKYAKDLKEASKLGDTLNKKIVEESVLRQHIDAAAEAESKITEILEKS